MTKETIIKLHAHFSKLAEEGGNTDNPVRNELIRSDAIRNKKELEKKFPGLKEKSKKNKK